ncbi:MAG: glycosyltransferase family 39 protein [Bacteroidetes bacterium]|nr:glycosyltransferase family 39 protein [Bacteroidota bacterium]
MRSFTIYLRSHPYIIAISLIAIIQISIILIYDFNGYFGQDSYEYLKTTRELITFYKGGILPSYSVFPGMYPFICSLIGLVIPNTLFVLQFVSILSLLISYILLRKIAIMIYKTDNNIDVYLFSFFALSPYILRFGIISMNDLSGIVLWLTTLYLSLLFQSRGKLKFLLFACLFGGFAVMTRYTAIVILLMPAVICIRQILKQKKYHYFLIALLFFSLGSLPDYLLRGRFFFWELKNNGNAFPYFYFVDQYSISNVFKRDFHNLDGWQNYRFPNIIHVMQVFIHPAFIFVGTLFLIFIRKKYLLIKELQLALLTTLIYLLFLAGNAYQSNRYLMFVLPLILLFYYGAFLEITSRINFRNSKKILIILIICSIQLFLFIYSFKTTLEMNRNEKAITRDISKLPEGSTIYSFSINGALTAYIPTINIYDIYLNKVEDLSINNGYFLFNYESFSKQFEGLLPMENYQFINSNYKLKTVSKFENGWEIYQIISLTK